MYLASADTVSSFEFNSCNQFFNGSFPTDVPPECNVHPRLRFGNDDVPRDSKASSRRTGPGCRAGSSSWLLWPTSAQIRRGHNQRDFTVNLPVAQICTTERALNICVLGGNPLLPLVFPTVQTMMIFTEGISSLRKLLLSATSGIHFFFCLFRQRHCSWLLQHRAMLRDPVEYPEPDVFKPERFLPKEGERMPREPSQMAFGYGRRYARTIFFDSYLISDTFP